MSKYKKGYPCKFREDQINHRKEIDKINQHIVGLGKGIIKMIKEEKHDCKGIIAQLLQVSQHCHQIASHILVRHIEECLKEEGFPGNEEKRSKEESFVLSLKEKLKPVKWAKKRLEDIEYD